MITIEFQGIKDSQQLQKHISSNIDDSIEFQDSIGLTGIETFFIILSTQIVSKSIFRLVDYLSKVKNKDQVIHIEDRVNVKVYVLPEDLEKFKLLDEKS